MIQNRMRRIYPYRVRYRKRTIVLAWIDGGNKPDSFVRSEDGKKLLSEISVAALRRRLERRPQAEWNKPASLNLDAFEHAVANLRSGRSSVAASRILLEGWNFLDDVVRTQELTAFRKALASPSLKGTYSKLFYGNNLPSVTPKGRRYIPTLTAAEASKLRAVLGRALRRVVSELELSKNRVLR